MRYTRKAGWMGAAFVAFAIAIFGLSPLGCSTAVSAGMPAAQNENVKHAQEMLHAKGFYKGKVDGIMGPHTRTAIREYQRSEKLPVTGRLDAKTASKMGVGQESVGASFASAGRSVGSGSKAAASEITKGKPVAAGKEFGKGMGRFGEHIGKGVKKAVKP